MINGNEEYKEERGQLLKEFDADDFVDVAGGTLCIPDGGICTPGGPGHCCGQGSVCLQLPNMTSCICFYAYSNHIPC